MKEKRIVVKIGSSSLTKKDGALSIKKLEEHATAISHLMDQGYQVILISSGAVSAGFRDLGYSSRPVTVQGKQAAAAVGQGLLIEAYNHIFKTNGYVSAQLLLTRDVFSNEEQFNNVYRTLSECLKRRVIPIINENDSVAIEELTFGDNDMLSAQVSGLVNADQLILLTDVNGIYNQNPTVFHEAKRYDHLAYVPDRLIDETSNETGSKVGTGGMRSKLIAAKLATNLGVNCFVGTGSGKEKLLQILAGDGDGTYIGTKENVHVRKHKQWIAFHSKPKGRILIDEGAKQAILEDGKSLLAAGILAVEDDFSAEDIVSVYFNKTLIAKGQVHYSSEEIKQVRGLASREAMALTGCDKPEIIHRNHLILTI